MLPETDTPAGPVWVLMFDQLPDHVVEGNDTKPSAGAGNTASSVPVSSPFDDLDLQSSFFEQHVLQDVRKSAGMTDILGGVDAVSRFTARIREAGKSSCVLRIACTSGHPGEIPLLQSQEYFLSDYETSTTFIQRVIHTSDRNPDEIDESGLQDDPELHSSLTAGLIWVEAQTRSADDQQAAAAAILRFIQRLRFGILTTPSLLPVLIVTTLRGSAREIAPPFTSGLSESRIHVPLWIDHGAGHACRIQALTGSFDLLPTVAEYLTGASPASEPSPFADRNLPDRSVQLSRGPMSLVRACEHQRILPDRLLRLTGDSWNALRTQQYLLVHSLPQDNSPDASERFPDEAQGISRRLYLKPDDAWNVNDAVVAYAGIADQMEAAAAEPDSPAGGPG